MHWLGQNENWLLLILNGEEGGRIGSACVRFVHAVQRDRIVLGEVRDRPLIGTQTG